MVKHTPGPWTFEPADLMHHAVVANQDRIIARCESSNVAYCHREGAEPTQETVARINANARLIAAAPELLEHIQKDRTTFAQMEMAASMMHRLEWAEASRVAKEACDAIIAKAEGASS